ADRPHPEIAERLARGGLHAETKELNARGGALFLLPRPEDEAGGPLLASSLRLTSAGARLRPVLGQTSGGPVPGGEAGADDDRRAEPGGREIPMDRLRPVRERAVERLEPGSVEPEDPRLRLRRLDAGGVKPEPIRERGDAAPDRILRDDAGSKVPVE